MSMTSNASNKPHREIRDMPYRLRQAVAVYLDNKQFLEGFTLLNSLLTSGRSNPNAPPVYIPPSSFFELAATLSVHPRYTTRAKSAEDLRAADEALRFLNDTCSVVGPVTTNLSGAFLFRSPAAGLGGEKRKRKRGVADPFATENGYGSTSHDGSAGSDMSEDDGEEGARLKSVFAGDKSVFRQRGKEDFWSVVGWAFNCSIKHKKRWVRWKIWLECMIEIVEEDLGLRLMALSEAIECGANSKIECERLAKECLLGRYCNDYGRARGPWKRVVRSVLADGSETSLREFGEVWKNETKERKIKKDDVSQWDRSQKLDLENDQWGDFGMKDDEDDVEDNTDDKTEGDTRETEPDFGGADSMKLRQRLLKLLLNLTNSLPGFAHIEALYDIYAIDLRSLPLPLFRDFFAMLAPMGAPYPTTYHIALLVNTLIGMLVSREDNVNIFDVTQKEVIKRYVPHATNATAFTENAKMSLLVEHLLFYMWTDGRLEPSKALTAAVEKGINARHAKATGDYRKKDKSNTAEEQSAKVVLELSEQRIEMLMGMMDPGHGSAVATLDGPVDVEDSMYSSSQLSDVTETPSFEDDEDSAMTPT